MVSAPWTAVMCIFIQSATQLTAELWLKINTPQYQLSVCGFTLTEAIYEDGGNILPVCFLHP